MSPVSRIHLSKTNTISDPINNGKEVEIYLY